MTLPNTLYVLVGALDRWYFKPEPQDFVLTPLEARGQDGGELVAKVVGEPIKVPGKNGKVLKTFQFSYK